MITKQFTLYLKNRPGELARVSKTLASAGINIEGISAAVTPDVGLVQLVVDNAGAARRTLTRRRVPFTEQNVAVLKLMNRPGALAEVSGRLTREGLNINYLYCTTCKDCARECSVVVSGDNLERIEKLWKQG
jgi:hypothetical protein